MNKVKNQIPREGEVDIVYIWCDSNNPEYIANRSYYAKQYKLNSYWSPTRDHGEILHSIKSVRKNMSWVRKIFICAPRGHRVKKLDTKKYNIEYVDNEEVLGEQNCPNFNSHGLELYTHRIKGLSDFFIQFNDDFFINEIIKVGDFFNFDTNKIKYYYEYILLLGEPLSNTTQDIVQALCREKYYFWATHSPRMYYKSDIGDIVSEYKNTSQQTKQNRFRKQQDIQLTHLYGYYLLSKNKGEFIFLENMNTDSGVIKNVKILISKLFTENLLSVIHQIYLQTFYKKKLHQNKSFLSEKKYALINIGNNHKKNKSSIFYCIINTTFILFMIISNIN